MGCFMFRQQRVVFYLIILLAAPLPLALAAPVAAQGDTQTKIVGYVKDAGSREPIVSARVDLMSPNGLASPTTYTNTDGVFYFERVGDGDYHLKIRKVGYLESDADVSVMASHQSRVDIDLHRETSDVGSAPASSETISSHQLTVPINAREDYMKGKDLMTKRDYSAAVAQFNKAVNEFAPYYEAYADMGVAQFLLGHTPEARASMQKSIDLSEGKFPDAIFDLANLLNDTGDYAGAEPLARQEIVLEESSWRGYFQLARALLGLKQIPDANRNARKAQTLNAQNRQIYVILTNIDIARRDYPSVLQDIDAYLKLDPDSPASDQMRATRAQVARALAAAPAPPAHTPQ
jgi:tetratricopeptide (TPR) repeat protein